MKSQTTPADVCLFPQLPRLARQHTCLNHPERRACNGEGKESRALVTVGVMPKIGESMKYVSKIDTPMGLQMRAAFNAKVRR
jgi:hypothetical protein